MIQSKFERKERERDMKKSEMITIKDREKESHEEQ